MTMHYRNSRETASKWTLPSIETFHRTEAENAADGWEDSGREPMGTGWYHWFCFPGCMPEGDACGPFGTEAEALADAREWMDDDDAREGMDDDDDTSTN